MRNITQLVVGSITVLALASGGCGMFRSGGSTVALTAGPGTPAAQGEVVAKATKEKNTEVTVKVKHLAPPEKIAQGATTYVVWVQPLEMPLTQGESDRAALESSEGEGTGAAGVYNVGGFKIGKNQDGKLKTTTPFKSFVLFITPESSSEITQPSGDRILWASITGE